MQKKEKKRKKKGGFVVFFGGGKMLEGVWELVQVIRRGATRQTSEGGDKDPRRTGGTCLLKKRQTGTA